MLLPAPANSSFTRSSGGANTRSVCRGAMFWGLC
jgi:hypothetical protein